jgi:hypothetical protein
MPKSPQNLEKTDISAASRQVNMPGRADRKRAHVHFVRLLLGEVVGETEIGKKK